MSPSTTEQSDLERLAARNHTSDEQHDPEAIRREEVCRGFLRRRPSTKPLVFLVAIVALLLAGWFWWEKQSLGEHRRC